MAYWQIESTIANIADVPGVLPASRVGGRWSRMTNQPSNTHLMRAQTELTGFRQEFELAESGLLKLTASVDIVHRGISSGGTDNYPIGIAIRATIREASTQAGLSSAAASVYTFAYSAGNIASLVDHYGHMIFSSVPRQLTAGWKRISLLATAHTSAADFDGTAMLNGAAGTDYNYLLTEFEPGVSFTNSTT